MKPVIAVLGAGNMAGAIVRRLAVSSDAEFRVTTRSSRPEWVDALPAATHAALANSPHANVQAVSGASVVILGVEPGEIVALAREISPALAQDAMVVSVAGGVTLADLAGALPAGAAVVRTMPNIPVEVGRGVTAFALAPKAPAGTGARVRELLAPTGDVEELAEELIDGFSAVIGSGPAYVYAIVEALQLAAVEQGLTAQQAAQMVPAMMSGALEYLAASGADAAQLREQVTSPGGSTAQALRVFEERGLAGALIAGVAAAHQRASELGRG